MLSMELSSQCSCFIAFHIRGLILCDLLTLMLLFRNTRGTLILAWKKFHIFLVYQVNQLFYFSYLGFPPLQRKNRVKLFLGSENGEM